MRCIVYPCLMKLIVLTVCGSYAIIGGHVHHIVPNRNSPPAVLLRESYREGKKVLKRTIANLSEVSRNIVEGLRILLRGGAAVEHFEDSF
jgi:hypothetical protein